MTRLTPSWGLVGAVGMNRGITLLEVLISMFVLGAVTLVVGCGKADATADQAIKAKREAMLTEVRHFRDKIEDQHALYVQNYEQWKWLQKFQGRAALDERKQKALVMLDIENAMMGMQRVERDLQRAVDVNDDAGVLAAYTQALSILKELKSKMDKVLKP